MNHINKPFRIKNIYNENFPYVESNFDAVTNYELLSKALREIKNIKVPTKTSELINNSGFINAIKTINGNSLIGSGNIELEGIAYDDTEIWAKVNLIDEDLGVVQNNVQTLSNKVDNAVSFNDIATYDKAGIMKINSIYGFNLSSDNTLFVNDINLSTYNSISEFAGISKGTLENIKYDLIKRSLVDNTISLTDSEKLKIESWLGLSENYLTYYNETPYQVNGDYVPAHKKYVDDIAGNIESLLASIDTGEGV